MGLIETYCKRDGLIDYDNPDDMSSLPAWLYEAFRQHGPEPPPAPPPPKRAPSPPPTPPPKRARSTPRDASIESDVDHDVPKERGDVPK